MLHSFILNAETHGSKYTSAVCDMLIYSNSSDYLSVPQASILLCSCPSIQLETQQLLITYQVNYSDLADDKKSMIVSLSLSLSHTHKWYDCTKGKKCIHFNLKLDIKRRQSGTLERSQKSPWESHFSSN